jgi:tRNA nucleotidyltransferase (CCA-adding enzyme)
MNAHQLIQHYHDKYLVPGKNELSQIQSRVDSLINAFQHSSYFAPMEVFIAGSFKKGTMIAGRGEADLEFFYRNSSIHFQTLRYEAIRIIETQFPEAEIEESSVAVTVIFPFKENDIEVDIVVGYPVNSPKQQSQVSSSDHYTITTGRTHVKYVKKQKSLYPQYQSTVRLVKDWRDAYELNLKSLHIELIVASLFATWDIEPMEYPGILHSFFRLLTSMCDGSTEILPVNWDLYDEDDISAYYTDDHVMIVDPADPSDNLADSLHTEDIAEIKSAATRAIYLINNNQWADLFGEDIIEKWQAQQTT